MPSNVIVCRNSVLPSILDQSIHLCNFFVTKLFSAPTTTGNKPLSHVPQTWENYYCCYYYFNIIIIISGSGIKLRFCELNQRERRTSQEQKSTALDTNLQL